MRIRKTFFRVLLTLTILCTGSAMTKTAQSFGCTQFCANAYNACMIDCNGDQFCQFVCYNEWQCCNYMCSGSGVCP